jgi:hypothetical protein
VASSQDDLSDSRTTRDTIYYVCVVAHVNSSVLVGVFSHDLRLSMTSHSQLSGIWYNHFRTSTLVFLHRLN